jgi:hypothetical protein
VLDELSPPIEQGGGTLEYRFRHGEGNCIWIQDIFKVMHDDAGRPSKIVESCPCQTFTMALAMATCRDKAVIPRMWARC